MNNIQTLSLMDTYFADVLKGLKLSTIRLGKRDIKAGPLKFVSNRSATLSAVVWVTSVNFYTLSELALKIGQPNEELILKLRSSYPDISDKDDLTVVSFLPPHEAKKKMS
jgi:hypothetical protein